MRTCPRGSPDDLDVVHSGIAVCRAEFDLVLEPDGQQVAEKPPLFSHGIRTCGCFLFLCESKVCKGSL